MFQKSYGEDMRIPRFALVSSLFFVLFAGAGVIAFGPYGDTADQLSSCREHPTSECLLDVGVSLMTSSKSQRRTTGPTLQLALVGRIADARAVYELQSLDAGKDPETARAFASAAVSRHELTAALQGGLDLNDALLAIPHADSSSLWFAGQELLGQNPYGLPQDPSPSNSPQEHLDVVSDMASKVVRWCRNGSKKCSTLALSYAAELRAHLHDRTGIEEILQIIEPSALLSERVFKVAGSENVLSALQKSDTKKPHNLLIAAGAETDKRKTQNFLSEAFSIYAERRVWPDFGKLEMVVRRGLEVGEKDFALQLSHRMVFLADATEYPFQVFGHIYTAMAMHMGGAHPDAITKRLEKAESLFPEDPRNVVAEGLISGPIQWKQSGLEKEARWRIALVSAHIGDVDRAKRMLEGLDDPVFAWLPLSREDIPVHILSELMAFAQKTLQPHDYAYVAGQSARFAATSNPSEQHKAWALTLARDVSNSGHIRGEYSVNIFNALARVAFVAGDVELANQVLANAAVDAFEQRDAAAIVNAGFLFQTHIPSQQ